MIGRLRFSSWICFGLSIALGVVCSDGAYGQSAPVRDLGGGWYEAVGTAPLVNITPEQARRRALQDAREQALMFAVGVDITDATLWHQAEEGGQLVDQFYSLNQQVLAGRVVEERNAEWSRVNAGQGALGMLAYKVKVELKVEPEKGDPDPGFSVEVRLNREVFRPGEEMRMEITAPRPCYVNVFCLTASDTVVTLLPHRDRSQRAVAYAHSFLASVGYAQRITRHHCALTSITVRQ